MADTSVRELILAHIESVLATIDGVSFDTNLAHISRKLLPVQEIQQFPAALIIVDAEPKTTDDSPCGLTNVTMQLTIELWIPDDYENPEEDLSKALRDVETVLMTDVTRGGNAINTELKGDRDFITELNNMQGTTLQVEVFYRHSVTDPSSTVPNLG